MSEANPQQEPSMEEILASIRRIISEDDKPEAGARAADDVLELTEVVEEPPEAEPKPEPEAAAPEDDAPTDSDEDPEQELSIDDVLDEADTGEELELRDAGTPFEAASSRPAAGSGLLATHTESAAAGSLSALVNAVDRARGGSTLGDGNRTIEDLVKELMRPMVKEWLDENLPRLTERLVRREIERLARNAEGD